MTEHPKPPSGRDIWIAVREELRLNLYELPYSTLCPTVYHVYLHPEDFQTIEGIVPRLVAELHQALTGEVERLNRRVAGASRRALGRILQREEMAAIDLPPDGWDVSITADQDGELARGHLGILSSLSMPAPATYAGTPTTRIVRSVVSGGRRTSTTTDVPQDTADRTGSGAASAEPGARARLTYEDDQGRHEFTMQKDSLVVGRGGSAAWVDVQVVTTAKVSREHVRIRREPSGRFVIQDVSLWGTSVNGEPLPPAVKTAEGVLQPGAERDLPPRARIDLAAAILIQFEAVR
jgi:pSer/pThr/pTyr-binding forkhead associated (FHA) protein